MEQISWEEFSKVELRVGKVLQAFPLPQARRPAYVLTIDFGPELGVKTSSAQLTALYTAEELIGKLVVAVVNLPPKQIGKVRSECLVTGFPTERGEVVLCVPERPVPLGAKLF
jgi:tRNA-binding protein